MELIEASCSRARVRTMPRLSRSAGFWAVAFSFLVVAAFSTAPSSLYVSPRVTLLVFALVVGLGILAAAPVLVRPADTP